MTHPSLMPDTYLPELGKGSGYFLLAFRGIAFGGARCNCLNRFYENVFGPAGETVLTEIRILARYLGNVGHRRIKLAQPGCARLTHDEASLLSALSAAQNGDRALMEAHLSWLMAGSVCVEISQCLTAISEKFQQARLHIHAPEAASTTPHTLPDKARLGVVGIA